MTRSARREGVTDTVPSWPTSLVPSSLWNASILNVKSNFVKAGDYVKITFYPDLKRFKMKSLDQDMVSIMSKRAYDIAGTMEMSKGKKLSVYLNGNLLPIKTFKDYLAHIDGLQAPAAYDKVRRRSGMMNSL
jgi:hypothetical protein